METFALRRHDLAMAKPEASDIIQGGDGAGYRWVLTETERVHILSMLELDASALDIRGNIRLQDRAVCQTCGKHSGLDDLVHNALFSGIHSVSFVKDVLAHGPKGPSPEHDLICSRCSAKHTQTFGWAGLDWSQ